MFFHRHPLFNADGSGGAADDGTDAGQQSEGQADDKKTFTQAELNALFGERARQAASKAVGDLLTALGVKDADELKGKLAKAKELEDAQKSELEKAQTEAASWKAKFEAEQQAKAETLSQAQEKLMRASVMAAASAASFADPNDAWLYVDRSKIAVEGDEFKGVKEAVEAVAKAKPYLVKGKQPTGHGTPQGGQRPAGSNGTKQPAPQRVRL